jgi:hypothetical protein
MIKSSFEEGKSIVKLMIIGMVVQLTFIGYVLYQGYEGRKTLVKAQRAGCERGKQDRMANARGWRIAEGARRADGQIAVANHYKEIAEGLEARSRTICSEAYPKASIIP